MIRPHPGSSEVYEGNILDVLNWLDTESSDDSYYSEYIDSEEIDRPQKKEFRQYSYLESISPDTLGVILSFSDKDSILALLKAYPTLQKTIAFQVDIFLRNYLQKITGNLAEYPMQQVFLSNVQPLLISYQTEHGINFTNICLRSVLCAIDTEKRKDLKEICLPECLNGSFEIATIQATRDDENMEVQEQRNVLLENFRALPNARGADVAIKFVSTFEGHPMELPISRTLFGTLLEAEKWDDAFKAAIASPQIGQIVSINELFEKLVNIAKTDKVIQMATKMQNDEVKRITLPMTFLKLTSSPKYMDSESAFKIAIAMPEGNERAFYLRTLAHIYIRDGKTDMAETVIEHITDGNLQSEARDLLFRRSLVIKTS